MLPAGRERGDSKITPKHVGQLAMVKTRVGHESIGTDSGYQNSIFVGRWPFPPTC